MRIKDIWLIVALFFTGLLIFSLLYPMLGAFLQAFTDHETGELTIRNFEMVLTQLYPYQTAIKNSFFIGIMGAITPFLIALPLAYLISRYEFPSKTLLLTLISISMVLPAFIGAYFWVILLGRFGIITGPINELLGTGFSIYGESAIIWAFTWGRYPLVFIILYSAFSTINPEMEEAAQNLGATPRKTFSSVTVKMVLPAVVNAIYLSFIMCITDIGTPMMLGGGYIVLPTLMYQEYLTEVGTGSIPVAGAIGILLLLINTGVLFLGRSYLKRRKYETTSVKRMEAKRFSGRRGLALVLCTWIVVGIGLLPWVFAIPASFIEWGKAGRAYWDKPTLGNYITAFTQPTLVRGIGVTIFLTVVSLLLMIAGGLFIAYVLVKKSYPVLNQLLDALVSLPLIIPGTVLALGYVAAFNRSPIILTGTWIILALCFFVRRIPHMTKSVESALYSISDEYEEASLNLGAPPMKTFRKITARMMVPGLISGTVLAFLYTIGTFSSTIILYTAPWTTLPILIYQQSTVNAGIAASLSFLMFVLTIVPLMILNKLTGGGIRISV